MNHPMRARDWFTVGFRLFGVWMLLESVPWIVGCAEVQFGFSHQGLGASMDYILHAAVDLAVGVALLRCKISLFWPEPDPDGPAFEVVVPGEDASGVDAEGKI